MSPADPDRALLDAIRAGDTTAFDTLYLQYRARLWAFAWQIVRADDIAEDVVQDVFLSCWERRQEIRVQHSVKVWLFGAVRNRALELLRRDQRRGVSQSTTDDAVLHNVPSSATTPLESLTRDEQQRAVDAAIAALPERQRSMVLLRWRDDLTLAEIGALLGISAVAVHKSLAQVERRLRPLLEAYYRDSQ